MDMLGLSEEELCRVLDTDPLTLLSGQLDHRGELPILLDLLDEASERAGPAVLARWVRASGPAGRPIDALLRPRLRRVRDRPGRARRAGLRPAEAGGDGDRGPAPRAHAAGPLRRVRPPRDRVQRALPDLLRHEHDRAVARRATAATRRCSTAGSTSSWPKRSCGSASPLASTTSLRCRSPSRTSARPASSPATRRVADPTSIVEGELRHVLVDLKTIGKTPIPDWAREGLERFRVTDDERR